MRREPVPLAGAQAAGHGTGAVAVPLEAATRSETYLGAKAANLARAPAAGHPVVTGLVLPVEQADVYGDRGHPDHQRVVDSWLDSLVGLSSRLGTPLVVWSSSPNEDSDQESKAGWYTSVVDVIGGSSLDRATGQRVGRR